MIRKKNSKRVSSREEKKKKTSLRESLEMNEVERTENGKEIFKVRNRRAVQTITPSAAYSI